MSDELATAHQWGELADGRRRPTAAGGRRSAAAEGGAELRRRPADRVRGTAARTRCGPAPDERIEGNIGIGVRVLVDGAVGLRVAAAARGRRRGRWPRDLALRNARAAAAGPGEPVVLPPQPAAVGRYETEAADDPFAVSAADRERVCWTRWPRRWPARRGAAGAGRRQRQAAAPALREHRGLPPAPALRRDRRDAAGDRRRRRLTSSGAATPTRSTATPPRPAGSTSPALRHAGERGPGRRGGGRSC